MGSQSELAASHKYYLDTIEAARKEAGESGMAAMCRHLCRTDLFFLLVHALGRKDLDHPWLYDRCMEVQASPDGHLDLWAREHGKSSIITYGKTIQDILLDPEITVGIFSHTRPIAKSFLRQIKREFESNEKLKSWFPDILWAAPHKEAPKWSEDDGIIVKRVGNPKESTVEAWGLVDGQPTGRHFKLMVYDDVVTRESVTSPDMIAKTTDAWALSLNLGSEGGRARYIGTRYHYNDTYRTMMSRGSASPRLYPATEDGRMDGVPVLLTSERLAEKRRDMGPFVFACQLLQDPKADEAQGFMSEWLRFWKPYASTEMNRYLLVDPASEKKKTSDYTCAMVVGLAPDGNHYIIDMVRDRLNLTERGRMVMNLHRQYSPKAVGYEKYGIQADIEFIAHLQDQENYHFDITPLGGSMAKNDRIRRLVPLFEQGRVYLPQHLFYVDYERRTRDLTREFIDDEFLGFPVAVHDDMLDCLARITDADMAAVAPKPSTSKVSRLRRVERRSAMAV